jgi:hypothetical protein
MGIDLLQIMIALFMILTPGPNDHSDGNRFITDSDSPLYDFNLRTKRMGVDL